MEWKAGVCEWQTSHHSEKQDKRQGDHKRSEQHDEKTSAKLKDDHLLTVAILSFKWYNNLLCYAYSDRKRTESLQFEEQTETRLSMSSTDTFTLYSFYKVRINHLSATLCSDELK